jgi:hypothetical protein
MEVLHPHCAGLDVHKDSVVACVRHMMGGAVKREEDDRDDRKNSAAPSRVPKQAPAGSRQFGKWGYSNACIAAILSGCRRSKRLPPLLGARPLFRICQGTAVEESPKSDRPGRPLPHFSIVFWQWRNPGSRSLLPPITENVGSAMHFNR